MPCLNECSDSPMCTATLMGDGAPVSISCGTQDELAAAIESVAGRPCSEPCKQCMAETMRSLCGSLGGLASSFASSFSSDTPDEGDLGGTASSTSEESDLGGRTNECMGLRATLGFFVATKADYECAGLLAQAPEFILILVSKHRCDQARRERGPAVRRQQARRRRSVAR